MDASLRSCMPEPLRILVVDDDEPFRYLIRHYCARFSAITVVGEATDGLSAIEMAIRLVPAVIIMDVQMPRVDGVEATRRIKKALPGIHVIGVSSQDDPFTKEAMQAVGSSAFVTKECAHTLPHLIAKITGSQMANDTLA